MDQTPHLALPFLLPSQLDKHLTFNDLAARLDALVQLAVLDRTRTAPPANPAEGARHLVATGPTGAWAGHAGAIAHWLGDGWEMLEPRPGWIVWVEADGLALVRTAGGWQPLAAEEVGRLGINATATAPNRLAVASSSVLFTHEGAGTRLAINRAAAAETASLVFQTGFAGSAEFGLCGTTLAALKVADTGGVWRTAWAADPATGRVTLPAQIASGDAGRVLVAEGGAPMPCTGLLWDAAHARLGVGASSPQASLDVTKAQADRTSAALALSGWAQAGPAPGDAHGFGLFLTYNQPGNRQFAFLSTDTQVGLRIVAGAGPIIDGYAGGDRAELSIGSNTHGASISYKVDAAHFSVSNHDGTVARTVCALAGASGQTGPLLAVRRAHYAGSAGDALLVTATGRVGVAGQTAPSSELDVAGAVRPGSYPVASLPSAAAKGAGAVVFVPNESGGAVLAFSDGAVWRRVTDRAVVS